jgi:hypothetical protein
MAKKRTNEGEPSEMMAALARIREIDKKWGTRHNLYEHLSTEPVGVEDWEIELVDLEDTN